MNAGPPPAPELVWVGTHRAAEVAACWNWCQGQTHLQHRASLDELAERPIGGARRVMVVRLSREPQNQSLWTRAAAAHPRARWAHLLGSLCEGEARTGNPWPGFTRILWHRWQDRLPDWLAAATVPGAAVANSPAAPLPAASAAPRAAGDQRIALCASRFASVAGLYDLLAERGNLVVWARPGELARGTGWTAILWDESAIAQQGAAAWAQRAAALARGGQRPPRQAVLLSAPRPSDYQLLRRAAVSRWFTKPVDTAALAGWLDAAGAASSPLSPEPGLMKKVLCRSAPDHYPPSGRVGL